MFLFALKKQIVFYLNDLTYFLLAFTNLGLSSLIDSLNYSNMSWYNEEYWKYYIRFIPTRYKQPLIWGIPLRIRFEQTSCGVWNGTFGTAPYARLAQHNAERLYKQPIILVQQEIQWHKLNKIRISFLSPYRLFYRYVLQFEFSFLNPSTHLHFVGLFSRLSKTQYSLLLS